MKQRDDHVIDFFCTYRARIAANSSVIVCPGCDVWVDNVDVRLTYV
jgi:hypothetical protein